MLSHSDMADCADIDKLLSELRHGHSCLLLNDNSAGGITGFVMTAAEHCQADHIAFMARQARGLVCLALTCLLYTSPSPRD